MNADYVNDYYPQEFGKIDYVLDGRTRADCLANTTHLPLNFIGVRNELSR